MAWSQQNGKKKNKRKKWGSKWSTKLNESLLSDSTDTSLLKWSVDESVILWGIDLKIQKGEFIMIVGEVGAGKSSLLATMISDLVYVNNNTLDKMKDMELTNDVKTALHQAGM